LRDCDVVLLDALVACGEALEDPEKSWSETRGLVHEAVLAHPAAEGLRSRLQLNEELIALSPTEMLFMPLVEDLPRKEGGGWSPEVHAVLAAEAKRLVGMARHAPEGLDCSVRPSKLAHRAADASCSMYVHLHRNLLHKTSDIPTIEAPNHRVAMLQMASWWMRLAEYARGKPSNRPSNSQPPP